MQRHELIAIIPAPTQDSTPDGLRFTRSGLACAVTRAHAQPVISLPQTKAQALSRAAQRQVLLEACMPHGPVLAVRPNCFVAHEEIPAMLQANAPVLAQLHNRFAGLVQFQITVAWDAPNVLARFRDTPELRGIFAAPQATQEALHQAVTALAKRLEANMLTMLAPCATEMMPLPRDRDILLNQTVCIAENQAAQLDEIIEKIDAIWTEGFKIRQIGPAPPTSFALIDPAPITADNVADALRLLSLSALPDPETLSEYRRAALLRSPQDAERIKHCADIVSAASRIEGTEKSFLQFWVLSEDQSPAAPARKVA